MEPETFSAFNEDPTESCKMKMIKANEMQVH